MAKSLIVNLSMRAQGALKTIDAFRSKLNRLGAPINAIGAKLAKFGAYAGAAAFAGLAAGAAYAAKSILELGIKNEQTRISFQTMLGSVDKGNAMLAKLNKFANWTPFTNDKVIAAGKTLLGFGIEGEHISDVLKMVGDVASGSGKDFNELAMIFGKVTAKGKADSESLNQMSEAGIPIIKTLSEMYGKTGDEIYDMASKGKIGAGDITEAFRTMTGEGGLYFDMMKKQSETAGGMWSTIVGKLQLIGAQVGEAVLPAFKAVLGVLGKWVDSIKAEDIIELLGKIAIIGMTVVGSLMKSFNYFSEIGKSVFESLASEVSAFFIFYSGVAKSSIAGIVAMFFDMVNGILKAYNWVMTKFGKEGVELVKTPESMKNLGNEGKRDIETALELKKQTWTGQPQIEAWNRAKEKNAEIDAKREKLEEKINGFQEKALELRKKQAETEGIIQDKIFKPAAKATEAAKDKKDTGKTVAKASRSDTPAVDQMTRMGLYNRGAGAAVSPLDNERNTLIKQIVSLVQENNRKLNPGRIA